MDQKLAVVVTRATGKQGGAVVKSLLERVGVWNRDLLHGHAATSLNHDRRAVIRSPGWDFRRKI